jgi:hypothetical protein
MSFYNYYLNVTVGNDWAYVPNPVVVKDDDVIRVSLERNATGSVALMINGEVYANVTLVDGACQIRIEGLDYGEYDYNLTYSGDGAHESLSQAGRFKVTYRFRDNMVESEYPYAECYDFTVYLPDDATGTVTVVVDGNTYTAEVVDGKATFTLENLDMGEHPVEVHYSGDANYPPMDYVKVLNIAYYGPTAVLGERGVVLAINLLLPGDANGNLVVCLDKTGTWYRSKEISGGKASIDLSDLPIGIYSVRAVYDGQDYEVRPFTATFTVLPKINITQEVLVGDDINISMDLDDAEGYVIIYIDDYYVAREIVDGKINYSYPTKDIPYGNYSVSFQYIGNSFDRNVFNYWDPEREQIVPVEYIVNVMPQKFSVPYELEVDENGVAHIYLPGDANGIMDIYSPDGTLLARADTRDFTIRSFVADIEWNIRTTEDGRTEITAAFKNRNGEIPMFLDYYDDTIYAGFTQSSVAKIPKKVQRISAGSLSMLYTSSKTYSVKVYGPSGNLVKGVEVNFFINNVAYGKAITNANGVASIVISKNPGTYTIRATSLGVSASAKLTVNHVITLKTVKVKKSAKKLVLKATLKKVNGKYLKGKKITFKFNGKTYKAKTNKKGVAKVTIKKAVLKKLKVGKKIRYQATYLKDTVKKTVKVKK